MHRLDFALNTHLVAQLCENGVGWFIQLETHCGRAHGAVSGGVHGTILVVLRGSGSEL